MRSGPTQRRALAPSRSFAGMAPIISCLILAGCSTPTAPLSQRDSDVAQISESWKPNLLYLLASPHPRLYVELDAVEGCAPDEGELQKLRNFLSAYCNKPDGIEIVRSDLIPIKAAKAILPAALARRYMNGPNSSNASSPAFMYVLFYNYALSRDSAVAGGRGSRPSTAPVRPANPHAEVFPYPVIYFNTRYFLGMAQTETLLHETGHLLGLVSRRSDPRDLHCPNPACLMNAHLRPYRWLIGKAQKQLCPECTAELSQHSRQSPRSNLRFVGPVLVRSEAGYHVLGLPDRVRLVFKELTEQDCQHFAAAVHAEMPNQELRVDCLAGDELLEDSAKVREMINRLQADPLDRVRNAGPKVLLRACMARYDHFGQHANYVDTLRQAILLDGKDAWCYNQLAWVQATCSDASVRNGKEAVAAATKACELTGWSNWQFVDTLAAACAEAGDFKRAVELQEQALCTGTPIRSEQKAMQERVTLYKQSQPFRENSDKP